MAAKVASSNGGVHLHEECRATDTQKATAETTVKASEIYRRDVQVQAQTTMVHVETEEEVFISELVSTTNMSIDVAAAAYRFFQG